MGMHLKLVMKHNNTSVAYITSCLTMIMGYCLFVTGIVSPSWRLEIGYTYGLWVRCDDDRCKYVFIGFNNFMTVVQSGIILSLLLLTSSMICMLLEGLMRACHTSHKHVTRAGKVAIVAGTMGEILAAASLALYGYKTVMARERLPVLSTGFVLTGLGVIVSLIGTILQAMGPPSTWGQGMCCLAPKRGYRKNFPVILQNTVSDSPSADTYHCPLVLRDELQPKCKEKTRLISCFQTSKKGYIYNSVPSTLSSSLERGYRHYEELNFEDMPPPPLELLHHLPPVHPASNFTQVPLPAYQPQEPSFHNTIPSIKQKRGRASSSLRYSEAKSHSEQDKVYQQSVPIPALQLHRQQSECIPQATPRQKNKQQRSMVESAQRHSSLTASKTRKESREVKRNMKTNVQCARSGSLN